MALIVCRSSLSDQLANKLANTLYVTPKPKFFRGRGRGGYVSRSQPGLQVFIQQHDIIDGKDYVHLPFLFGCRYFNTNNDKLQHASVQMEYTGIIRDYQKPFVNAAIQQLNNKRTSILNLRPGFGKTSMATAISCKTELLTVILLHDSAQIIQWANTYKNRSTAITWSVGEE